ncbi:hypothetical protein TAL182_PE00361 (plasmid) [Rhizobium sp. TAL182]|nr:hypothetical protein TAL182_PE00361 [Rhizobium sp. TAL182]
MSKLFRVCFRRSVCAGAACATGSSSARVPQTRPRTACRVTSTSRRRAIDGAGMIVVEPMQAHPATILTRGIFVPMTAAWSLISGVSRIWSFDPVP